MTTELILFIILILYMIGLLLAINFDIKILMFVSILWFVPIYLVDNAIIVIFSVIMFIIHISIPLGYRNGDDFD